jgi:hypothetical protein
MASVEPRTSVVTIYGGDYLDRLRHLEQQHKAAVESERSSSRLLADDAQSPAIAAEHERLKAEAEETALHVTLRALGRKAWRALVEEHPPRPGVTSDSDVGVNEATFKEALVPASIVSPELSEDDLDAISDIDWDRLYFTAFALNRSPAASPKALVSPTSPESDETSN